MTEARSTRATRAAPPPFHVVLIKPTHYDDDGYPIQFQKSPMPSNTLACLNALAEDASRRRILGAAISILVHAIDETNQRVVPARMIEQARSAGVRALIAFVGVQSNQFPRAMDLARPFAAAGFPVCIGGFHVSGCIAMLPEIPAEIRAAQELGISLFAGEAENGRFDQVLRDAYAGQLKPLYNHMDDLPALEGEPPPLLNREQVERIAGATACIDLGRGCPFQCSFCTIINVQGRKSRGRTPDDLERMLRSNIAQGITNVFITDDNFARNKDWEPLLDRIIALRRQEGWPLTLSIQVDTLCHKIPRFIDKCAEAGVKQVFIGLENINPDNLIAAKKRQNKITDYRTLLQQWRAHGVLTTAGYILGFPADTKESILRDIEIIKRELPLDVLEFFYLTPLPGSEDHKVLLQKGVWMDPDLNKYDVDHRVWHHDKMSDAEWEEVFRVAWQSYYSPAHIRTILRRAAVRPDIRLERFAAVIQHYATAKPIEGVHPLECGVGRMMHRRDRRPGLPIETREGFAQRVAQLRRKRGERHANATRWMQKTVAEVLSAPDRFSYSDIAIAPQRDDEYETLALYHQTSGGEAALARKRRNDALRTAPTY